MGDGTAEKQKCPDCGLEFAEGVVGRCPRCGASPDEGLLHPPVLAHEEECNPYVDEYRRICACAGEGQPCEVTPGEYIVSMEHKAEEDDSMAQHFLAVCIYGGKDDRHALELLRRSAAQGNALAENSLGGCYSSGEGVAQDHYAAIRHYRKSAARGCVESIAALAAYYSAGEKFGLLRNDAKSFALMRIAAERGNARAQFEMFSKYWDGRGVERDLGEALMWCRLSAERGYAPAEKEMALCYDDGIGVHKDPSAAVKWFERAAGHGDLEAMLDLSVRCCYGVGTKKNPGRAYFLALSAVDAGLEEASAMVSHCFRNGIGVAKDAERADKWLFRALDSGTEFPWKYGDQEMAKAEFASRMRWAGEDPKRVMRVHWWASRFLYGEGVLAALDKAIALGDNEAKTCLGDIFENGLFGVKQDLNKAVEYYRASAASGDPVGEARLSNRYRLGYCDVKPDPAKAEELARRSAEKGCDVGAYALAGVLLDPGERSKQRREEGVEWLKKAAEHGQDDAMVALGMRLLSGGDVEKNTERGIEFLDRAVSNGDVLAMMTLGRCFACGNHGVVPDYARAWRYFSMAAERGVADAFVGLAVMQKNGLGRPVDVDKATELLGRGAELGSPLAYYRMGDVEYEKGHYGAAFKWYSKADEAGMPEGKYAVALMYWRGHGVGQNERKATAIARLAVAAGVADSEGLLSSEGVAEQSPQESSQIPDGQPEKRQTGEEVNAILIILKILAVVCLVGFVAKIGKEMLQ